MRVLAVLLLGVALSLAGCMSAQRAGFVSSGITPAAHLDGETRIPEWFNDHQNSEFYSTIEDNGFLTARQNPLSTFSIDVDTASYSNVRRFLNEGVLPPADAV